MAWACMATSGAGSLIFIDDVSHDGSSRIVHIIHQDNGLKHTANTTNYFFRGKK